MPSRGVTKPVEGGRLRESSASLSVAWASMSDINADQEVAMATNEMVANNIIPVVPSFLMESMVWNVPNRIFNYNDTWTTRLRESLGHIYNTDRSEWLEANNIKFLFHSSQAWSEGDAVTFVERAWRYMGFN